jgi:class 3 adenylate cyclase
MVEPEPTSEGEIRATVFFVDIINSTGLSGVQDPATYNRMLTEYQALVFDVITDHVSRYRYLPRRDLAGRGTDHRHGTDYEWDITGDEARVFLYSDNPAYDVRSAFQLAVKVKLAWLTSDFNHAAFEDKGLVFDVGIGIHAGKVIREVKDWRRRSRDAVPRIDGFAINIGKKVEGFSRSGRLFKICVSGNVRSMVEHGRNFAVRFSSDQQQKLKDSAITIAMFEVVSFLDHEVFAFFPEHLRERTFTRMLKMVEAAHLRRDLFWLYFLTLRYWLMDVTGHPHSRTTAEHIIRLGSAIINFTSQLSEPEQNYIRYYLAAVNNMVALAYVARGLDADQHFARKIFSATLAKIDQQNVPARVHLARQLLTGGDYKSATKYCADVLMLDPGNPSAQELIEQAARRAIRENARPAAASPGN